MEVTLYFKVYHQSYGSSFTSVATFLQKNTSGFPSSVPHGMRVRDSPMGPIKYISSHRDPVVSQGSMGAMTLLWHQGGLDLSKGREFHPCRPTCSYLKDGYFPEQVWQFRVNVHFQTLPTRNAHYKISLGMKICA